METAAGYAGAFIIGLILGLTGGGGSILTVPLLVYVMAVNPVTATAYSLFVVGTTSAFGSVQNYYNNTISFKKGLLIALPSFTAVYLTRRHIVPAIPDVVINANGITVTKGTFIMVLFAAIMFLAAVSMLGKKTAQDDEGLKKPNYFFIFPLVLFLGVLMGILGAGGGFLIIPMLVVLCGLPMKKAVGTSLFIIAINSLIGFMGDLETTAINWGFLLSFTMLSVFGIFAGIYLHKFVNETQLKRGFGWFVLIMAAFIFSKEIIGF